MRILMTQRDLTYLAGSEMVTVELAKELAERGQEVAVYTPTTGRIANIMISSGVFVRERLADLPWVPDVIHGQHHLQTMAALARFGETPAIYYCHGLLPWVERPPVHPRIMRYLMMCEWLVPRVEPEYGIAAHKVAVLPNFVNLTRFTEVRTPPPAPARAAVFGGNLPKAEMETLQQACNACGLSLEKIGYQHDNPLERPEIFLQKYDLVFAIGRCALEALACGCAVIPVMPGQAGELLTSQTLEQYACSNFSPRYFITAHQVGEAWLRRQLAAYDPAEVLRLTATIRQQHSLSLAVDRLQQYYAEALNTPAADTPPPATEFAGYLETIGRDANQMWSDLERFRPGYETEKARADELRKSLKQLERQLEKLSLELNQLRTQNGIFRQVLRDHVIGRWLLRRIDRLLRHVPSSDDEERGTSK